MIIGILNQEVNEVTSLFSVDKLGRGMPLNFNSQVMVRKNRGSNLNPLVLLSFSPS